MAWDPFWTNRTIAGVVGAVSAMIWAAALMNPWMQKKIKLPFWVIIICAAFTTSMVNPEITKRVKEAQIPAHTEAILLAIPIYAEIKRQEPETFKELVTRCSDSIKKDPDAGIEFICADIVGRLTGQRLSKASDEALLEFVRSNINILNAIYAQNPEASFRYMTKSADAKVASLIPKELLDRQLVVMNKILISSFKRNPPKPSAESTKPLIEKVMIILYKQYGQEIVILDKANDPTIDKAKFAKIYTEFLEQVLLMSPDDAAQVFRYLF